MKFVKTKELKNFDYSGLSDKGKVRLNNEDKYGYFDTINGDIFIVSDGIGGNNAGDKAAELTISSIADFFSKEWYSNIQYALLQSIEFANSEILSISNRKPELSGMGATISIVLIRDNEIFFAHAGDSRIYFYTEKKIFRLTNDHSFVQNLIYEKIITEEEALEHPKRNEITKALGIKTKVEPEICKNPIYPSDKDIILLCTDGLTTKIKDKEICKILDTKISVKDKVNKLVETANKNGGEDNITVQLIKFFNLEKSEKSKEFTKKTNLFKKHKGFFIIFITIIAIITSAYYLIDLILREIKDEQSEYQNIKTENAVSFVFALKKNRKDTITTVFIENNKDILFELSKYNVEAPEIGYPTALRNTKSFYYKFFVPVQAIYKVRAGDEILILEKIFKISFETILQVNNKHEFFLKPGEILIIPKKQQAATDNLFKNDR